MAGYTDHTMKRYVVLNKKVGETPLSALDAWKAKNTAYKNVSASYAGRLDPMASGKLLVLLGDECKKQAEYTGLDKEYVIEVLFGVGSDTGDALGIVELGTPTLVSSSHVRQVLVGEIGKQERPYPRFSSKTVNGKPLFLHTLSGTIEQVEIPTHTEEIFRIALQNIKNVSAKALQKRVEKYLCLVPKTDEPSKRLGEDFRINDVRASWERVFGEEPEGVYTIATLRVTCGSGTYMRSLAGRLGEALHSKALALSIKRTRIGTYKKGRWTHSY